MIQALNIQATTNNALYNKGVAYCVSAFESLNTERKIIEKKTANNLLTHTQAHLAFNHIFFLPSYARAKRGVTLVNKGLHGVSFVRFFVPVCEQAKRQNKDILSTDFTITSICNSLVIVCFLSLISRAGSGNTLSACRGERGQAIRKDK